jgi:tripartite motif-containing protein 33
MACLIDFIFAHAFSDGGELMCCDKCPKVFHQACHIPVISSLPDESETWQCLLCYNFADATPGTSVLN